MWEKPNFSKENKTDFFLNNFPLVRGLHQFMRARLWLSGHRNICEALCPVSALSGGEEGSGSTWLEQSILHHIILSLYF